MALRENLGPAFVATLAIKSRVGAGSNGAVLKAQQPPDPKSALLAAAASAAAGQVPPAGDAEEDRSAQRQASTATLSTQPIAMKVVSHFWDESAAEALDVERKTLLVSGCQRHAAAVSRHGKLVQRLPAHPNVLHCYGVDKQKIPRSVADQLPEDMAYMVRAYESRGSSSSAVGFTTAWQLSVGLVEASCPPNQPKQVIKWPDLSFFVAVLGSTALPASLTANISQANSGQYKAQFFAFQYHPISLDQFRKCFPSPMPYHMLFRVTVELLLVRPAPSRYCALQFSYWSLLECPLHGFLHHASMFRLLITWPAAVLSTGI